MKIDEEFIEWMQARYPHLDNEGIEDYINDVLINHKDEMEDLKFHLKIVS